MSQTMTKEKKDRMKSIRLPSAGDAFRGREPELEGIQEAFLEKGARGVSIYGPAGSGKTSLAVRFAQSAPPEVFEYVYTFECRGGLRIEEVLYRLCQFLDFHSIGSYQNILLSPVPLELKLDLMVKVLKKLKILLIFDDIDSLLTPEHGRLVIEDKGMAEAIAKLLNECEEGARLLFTGSVMFEAGSEHMQQIELAPKLAYTEKLLSWLTAMGKDVKTGDPAELTGIALDTLSGPQMKALKSSAAFEKAAPIGGLDAGDADITALVDSGLLSTFIAGGEAMYSIHSIVRAHLRESLPKEDWKSNIEAAATFREKYAKEHGLIWHMIYAHALYVEAMRFEKAAEIAHMVTHTLLAWGQTGLAFKLNSVTVDSVEGAHKARALYTLGCIEMGNSNYDRSLDLLTQARELFDSLDDSAGLSDALTQIATVHNNRKNFDESLALFNQALAIKEELSDKRAVSSILSRLAQIYQDTGESDKAVDTFSRSASLSAEDGNERSELLALEKLGGLHASRGEVEQAIEVFEKSLVILVKGREPNALTRAYNRLGGLYFRAGNATKALECLKKSLKYSEVTRNKELSAVNILEMSRVYLEVKDYKASIQNAILAFALFDAASSESKSMALEILGHIEKEMGEEEFRTMNEHVLAELKEKGMDTTQ